MTPNVYSNYERIRGRRGAAVAEVIDGRFGERRRPRNPAVPDLFFLLVAPASNNAFARKMHDRIEPGNRFRIDRLARIPRNLIRARRRAAHQACNFISTCF